MILDAVLSRYPSPIASARWTALGSAGGFSGSRIWRGDAADGKSWAIKAHPHGMDAVHLSLVHQWMRTASGQLSFVPEIVPARDGRTVVESDGRCWECVSWMPGLADFHSRPTDVKLQAAVQAIAQIHQVWFLVREGPCPAIQRRYAVLTKWSELVQRGWRPQLHATDPIAASAQLAWETLPSLVPRMLAILEPWLNRLVPIQPCIGDVWHDHILFQGDAVSGVIDYAAAKYDHVATDLARLLGSMIPDDSARIEVAIRAYTAIRPLPNPELVAILDRSGVVASVANWLRRLYVAEEMVADRGAVAKRLDGMVRRMRGFVL